MAKTRTDIPADVASDFLFEQDHTCCICRERGKHVQIHHIDEDPSNHSPRNLAVLCLEDHNETQVRGGFGRKLSPETVVRYCDDWIEAVRRRRQEADRIAVERMSGNSAQITIGKTRPRGYNLIISGSEGAWDQQRFAIARDRFLKHTEEAIRARFKNLDVATIAELVRLPTIFAYEHTLGKP